MLTHVTQIDAARLPDRLHVPKRYSRAFVLIRWHGEPVATVTLPVSGGVIDGAILREAALLHAAWPAAQLRLRAFLGHDASEGRGSLPTVSVAVCTRDRPDDLLACLTAIDALDGEADEVLVVDSCSAGDDTRQVVARFPRVRYIRETRPGLDIARNRALTEARHDVVAFTDDDATPDPRWVHALQRAFTSPRTLCVTGLTLPAELETEAQHCFERTNGFGRGFTQRTFDGVTCDPFLVGLVGAGVNMALRRSVLGLIGPFDEALDAGTPTRSGGDHDMFIRIMAAGYCINYEPRALSWHRHRRDWSELRDTVRGYGTGIYAILTRHVLRRETRAPVIAMAWLGSQLSGLIRGRGSGVLPRGLALAELRGCLAGPRAYLVSRRRAARVTTADG
ncbi:MAG: glycosyltransferase family 2 protein [Gemmatimonadaceae bacterium]